MTGDRIYRRPRNRRYPASSALNNRRIRPQNWDSWCWAWIKWSRNNSSELTPSLSCCYSSTLWRALWSCRYSSIACTPWSTCATSCHWSQYQHWTQCPHRSSRTSSEFPHYATISNYFILHQRAVTDLPGLILMDVSSNSIQRLKRRIFSWCWSICFAFRCNAWASATVTTGMWRVRECNFSMSGSTKTK